MTDPDPRETLSQAARQLLAIEELLGSPYLPASRNPLPAGAAAKAATPAPAGRPATASETPRPAGPVILGANLAPAQKAKALHDLDVNEVRQCNRCGLRAGCAQTVFGEGDPNAQLVFVGEAPGAEEDRTGRPFVGRAGELLTKMIAAMGLTRRQVFICNMVKCRPPENRTPLPDEVEACWGYLIRQLQIIAPQVIVTLGNPATKGLLDTPLGITRLRGNWQQLPLIGEGLAGIPVMPTFHPAYLLRYYTPAVRQQVWSDLQQVMTRLHLPAPDNPG
jgi:DNA polymerase